MPSPADDAQSRKFVLIIAALSSFLPPFMSSSVNVALPAIGLEFSMDAILLSWVATSYLLAAAVFLVPFGRLADIYGMKRIFVYGLFTYTASSFLCGISPSEPVLLASRILQGIGSAMIFGTGMAILITLFPFRERGKVLGINVASVYLGLSLGPLIGGILTEVFGWRSLFLINVPLGLASLLLVIWKLEGEWAEAKGESFDLIGSVLYSLVLVTLMGGLSSLPDPVGGIMVLLGAIGLIALVRWESREKNPVLDISLFRSNRVYAFSNLAALINYSATFAVGFLLSLYLQLIKGLSPVEAGTILMAQPIMMTFFSPVAGWLSDKKEPRIVATAGMALTFLGVVLLSIIGQGTVVNRIIAGSVAFAASLVNISLGDDDLNFITGCLLILGIGLAFFSSPNTNAIMSCIERRCYGVGSATLGTMRLVGQVMSMGLAMLVFAIYMGRVEITPEYYPMFIESTKTAFILFSALCFAGIFASMARGEVRREEKNVK